MKGEFLIKFILNRLYYFVFVLLLTQLSSCGLHVNYKSDKFGNAPVAGGTKKGKEYKEAAAYYPTWNVKNIEENKKNLNAEYYASANFYNDMQYDVAKNYIEGYNSMLNISAEELQDALQNGKFDTSSKEIVEKVDIGQVRAYPPINNVIMVHKLNDEEQKMAIPSYLDDYIEDFLTKDVDAEKNQSESNENTIISATDDVKDYRNLSNDEKRDRYIEKQLAFTDAFEGISKYEYSELFLE